MNTPDAMILADAYREWFALAADHVDGTTAPAATFTETLASIRAAEAACPVADFVYLNTVAAYRREAGRDHITGERLTA